MGQFDRQIATAIRLIAKNGQSVTWRKVNQGVAPSDRPHEPADAAPTDYPGVKICFLPNNRVNQEFLRALGKTDVPTGNVYGLMGAVTFEPAISDVVLRGSEECRVNSIDALSPNGQIILYTIQFNL